MEKHKNPLPNWTKDEEVKKAKWIGDDDILVLFEDSETSKLSLELSDKDQVMTEDIVGMFADKVSNNELIDAYEDINTVDEFYAEKEDLVLKGRLRIEPIL